MDINGPARSDDDNRPLCVGLGASAGGLGALEEFFDAVPSDCGMAFIVVTHLHPGKPSLMGTLLARRTKMPVVEATAGLRVEANHVYIAQPGEYLAIEDGRLEPTAIPPKHVTPPMPIDFFFRTLARDQKERAVGVILSGTGSDGALGVREIKAELGLVMVQDEQTAEYGGMPHSAIATQLVDFVGPVGEMPRYLSEHAARVHRRGGDNRFRVSDDALRQILAALRERTGNDFSLYKRSTVERRVVRRIHAHRLKSAESYVRHLRQKPAEIDVLFKDLLIGVTSFLRDSTSWEVLATTLGEYLKAKPLDYTFRAWVSGCSTGEEAYSLAIIVREVCEKLGRPVRAEIFATDLDDGSIESARSGTFPVNVIGDLTAERLRRFFVQEEDRYCVRKEVREMVVFAPQNVIADPPFTRLDILVCRNLLIYFDGELQKRLIPILHYSLKPNGLLFLGSSESVAQFDDLFSQVEPGTKLYRCIENESRMQASELPSPSPGKVRRRWTPPRVSGLAEADVGHLIDRMLLRELVPPTVLVKDGGDVVHVHGRTGLFLEPAEGSQATANILNMARSGGEASLRAAIREAASTNRDVVQRNVIFRSNEGDVRTDVHVARVRVPEALRGLIRVSFVNAVPADERKSAEVEPSASPADDRLSHLERELFQSKQSHRSTIEELAAANEQLRSTNEEFQSTNEELQSANEELETSKEEMQSLNEELQTVNAELEGKLEELSRANNDLRNLLDGTDIATVFLNGALQIQGFTQQAKRVVRLIKTDIGRSIGDLASTLRYEGLVEDCEEVLRTLAVKETEARSVSGEYYLARILPYRTTENVIEGLVLTFIDITKVKTLQVEQERLLNALQSSSASVFGQEKNLRYSWASSSVFGKSPEELVGKTDEQLLEGQAAMAVTTLKKRVIASGRSERANIVVNVGDREREYEVFVQPLLGPDRIVVGVQGVVMEAVG